MPRSHLSYVATVSLHVSHSTLRERLPRHGITQAQASAFILSLRHPACSLPCAAFAPSAAGWATPLCPVQFQGSQRLHSPLEGELPPATEASGALLSTSSPSSTWSTTALPHVESARDISSTPRSSHTWRDASCGKLPPVWPAVNGAPRSAGQHGSCRVPPWSASSWSSALAKCMCSWSGQYLVQLLVLPLQLPPRLGRR